MSIGGGESSNTAQQQQQLATAGATSGLQKGSYSNGPQNAAQIGGALNSAQSTFENGTPTLTAGLDNINRGADAAGSLYGTADPQMASTINGSYTSAGNPYFSGMVDQMANALRPQVDSGFEANGRAGSGANAHAFDSALADETGKLAYQNYGAERGIQNGAMQNLPSYTAGMFQPGQAQLTAGYTPLNQFVNQLKSISPGTAGSFDTTTAGTSSGTQNKNTDGSGSDSNFGAKVSAGKGK